MQVLPLLGSGALIAAAGFAAWMAASREQTVIPLITGPEAQDASGASARQISLVPNARDDAFYTAITDRPLFQDSRRPIVPEAEVLPEPEVEVAEPEAPAPPQDIPPPDVRLLGVLSGGVRTSALLSLAGDDPQWQDIGAQIEGWTLEDIEADHVVFTEQERAHRVELYQR